MNLDCIVVEDEPLAIRLIEDNIRRIPFLNLKAVFQKADEAAAFLEKNPVHLAFLDIHLPGQSGLSLAKTIAKPTQIIFTTAYEQHAVDGFEIQAVDYLLKPIRFDRFEKACLKAKELYELRNPVAQQKIRIRADFQDLLISPAEILYVEGLKDYVKFYLAGNPKPVISRMNLKGAESILPEQFRRIHKSYIVNMPLITSISRDHVSIGEIQIPLGETFRRDFRETLPG